MRQVVANIEKYRMLIGGARAGAHHGDWFGSFDPYTGKPWVARAAWSTSSPASAANIGETLVTHLDMAKVAFTGLTGQRLLPYYRMTQRDQLD